MPFDPAPLKALVPLGKLRLGLFQSQWKKGASGQVSGSGTGIVAMHIYEALAARLEVTFELRPFKEPGNVIDKLNGGECDFGFMGFDPTRAKQVALTQPLLHVEFTCLVPAGSSIRSLADADRSDIRIAAVEGHESTAALRTKVFRAQIITEEQYPEAFRLLQEGKADVFASARPSLVEQARKLPSSRLLPDSFGFNEVTMAVPNAYRDQLPHLEVFVEDAKKSGLIAEAIRPVDGQGISQVPN